MRNKKIVFYSAVVSTVLFTGFGGSSALAESEAGFEAGSQASYLSSSENVHEGDSQSTGESITQGMTAFQSSASQENSTEAIQQTGDIPILQSSYNGRTYESNKGAQEAASGGDNAGGSRSTSVAAFTAPSSEIPNSKIGSQKIPVMETTTYTWGRGNSHSRAAVSRHTNYN
jgi:hypothetical protein